MTCIAPSRAVYERLKPGGFYVIVHHAAAAGFGPRDTQSLHRIDPVSVRQELPLSPSTNSGFVGSLLRAVNGSRWPRKVNLDGNAASHRALRLLGTEDPKWKSVVIRCCRYLNNIVEQGHRAIKRRCPTCRYNSARPAPQPGVEAEAVIMINDWDDHPLLNPSECPWPRGSHRAERVAAQVSQAAGPARNPDYWTCRHRSGHAYPASGQAL
jgi:hypothetical protein